MFVLISLLYLQKKVYNDKIKLLHEIKPVCLKVHFPVFSESSHVLPAETVLQSYTKVLET